MTTQEPNEFSKLIGKKVTVFLEGAVIHGTVKDYGSIFLTIDDQKTGNYTHIIINKIKSITEEE
jgi:hypothetical protein